MPRGTTFVIPRSIRATPYGILRLLQRLEGYLASTSTDQGASMIGIEDNGALYTATTVEGALAEVKTVADAALTTANDLFVIATVSMADVTGGATDGTVTVAIDSLDGSDITSARQVIVVFTANQYHPNPQPQNTVTFSAATTGSIITSSNGWALIQTDATGNFACTVSNSADETVYARVVSAPAISTLDEKCLVTGCVPDAVTWSA